MFFELRQYHIQPGKREEWVKFMEQEIIPFQVSQGMVIAGSFTGQDEEDLYVWIRRFESEEQRKEQYQRVYESDFWKEKIAPRLPDLMVRGGTKVTRIEPTAISVLH